MSANIIDMTGKRFGSVVAISVAGKATSGDIKWLFRCDCGNEFEANGYYARTLKVKSCPSCSRERSRLAAVKHGLTDSVEFSTWADIQTRCYNKKGTGYKNYGGRGISVCQRWLDSFENFLADMGPRPSNDHSIERMDNDGDYEPSNCRWATRIEQANNRRTNVNVTINGVTKTMSAWCKEREVLLPTASLRHKLGYRGEDLFKTTVAQITHDGTTDTILGWSKKTGIKVSTLHMRLNKYKWPIEKALTKGATHAHT